MSDGYDDYDDPNSEVENVTQTTDGYDDYGEGNDNYDGDDGDYSDYADTPTLPTKNKARNPQQTLAEAIKENSKFCISESLHKAVDTFASPTAADDDRYTAFTNLDLIQQTFHKRAKYWAIKIIEQRFANKKEVAPISTSGLAGGEKFICEGIFFKFCVDMHSFYGGDSNAMKAGHQEIKALQAIFDTQQKICKQSNDPAISKLRCPLSILINYRGYCIHAQEVCNLAKNSLVYGSQDQGRNFACDEKAGELISKITKEMNIKSHLLKRDVLDKVENPRVVHGPVDLEVHKGKDDQFYVIDCARIFPAVKAKELIHVLHIPSDVSKEVIELHMDRAELKQYFQKAIPKALISKHDGFVLIHEQNSVDPNKRAQHVLHADNINGDVIIHASITGTTLYYLFRQEFIASYTAPLNSDAFFKGFHIEDEDWRVAETAANCLTTAAISKIAEKFENNVYEVFTCKSLFRVLHGTGINMRFLGLLYYAIKKNEIIKQLLLQEMIARVLVPELRKRLRAVRSADDGEYSEQVILFLSQIFGSCESATYSWKVTIPMLLYLKFGIQLADSQSLSLTIPKLPLMLLTLDKSGARLTPKAVNSFQEDPTKLNQSNPFSIEDFESFHTTGIKLKIVPELCNLFVDSMKFCNATVTKDDLITFSEAICKSISVAEKYAYANTKAVAKCYLLKAAVALEIHQLESDSINRETISPQQSITPELAEKISTALTKASKFALASELVSVEFALAYFYLKGFLHTGKEALFYFETAMHLVQEAFGNVAAGYSGNSHPFGLRIASMIISTISTSKLDFFKLEKYEIIKDAFYNTYYPTKLMYKLQLHLLSKPSELSLIKDNTQLNKPLSTSATLLITGEQYPYIAQTNVDQLDNTITLYSLDDSNSLVARCSGNIDDGFVFKSAIASSLSMFDITDVSVGARHALALTSDGQAISWGANHYGQLGHEDDFNFITGGIGDELITQCHANEHSSFLVTASGKIFCCGSGQHFQLGMEVEGNLSTMRQLRAISAYNVTKVVCFEAVGAALTSENKLYCWGTNSNLYDAPLQFPTLLPGLAKYNFRDFHTNGQSFLAVTTDDKLIGWGKNFSNCLGLPRAKKVAAQEVPLPDGAIVDSIYFNYTNCSYLITREKRVLVAGNGGWGKLGTGNKRTVKQFTYLDGVSNVLRISGDSKFSAFLVETNDKEEQ